MKRFDKKLIKEIIKILKEENNISSSAIGKNLNTASSLGNIVGNNINNIPKINIEQTTKLFEKILTGNYWISKSKATPEDIIVYKNFLKDVFNLDYDFVNNAYENDAVYQTRLLQRKIKGNYKNYSDESFESDGAFGQQTLKMLLAKLDDNNVNDKISFQKIFPKANVPEEVINWFVKNYDIVRPSIDLEKLKMLGKFDSVKKYGINEPYLKARYGDIKEKNTIYAYGVESKNIFYRIGGSKSIYQKVKDPKILKELEAIFSSELSSNLSVLQKTKEEITKKIDTVPREIVLIGRKTVENFKQNEYQKETNNLIKSNSNNSSSGLALNDPSEIEILKIKNSDERNKFKDELIKECFITQGITNKYFILGACAVIMKENQFALQGRESGIYVTNKSINYGGFARIASTRFILWPDTYTNPPSVPVKEYTKWGKDNKDKADLAGVEFLKKAFMNDEQAFFNFIYGGELKESLKNELLKLSRGKESLRAARSKADTLGNLTEETLSDGLTKYKIRKAEVKKNELKPSPDAKPGDGYKYRGTGAIQTTGRSGFRAAGYENYSDESTINKDISFNSVKRHMELYVFKYLNITVDDINKINNLEVAVKIYSQVAAGKPWQNSDGWSKAIEKIKQGFILYQGKNIMNLLSTPKEKSNFLSENKKVLKAFLKILKEETDNISNEQAKIAHEDPYKNIYTFEENQEMKKKVISNIEARINSTFPKSFKDEFFDTQAGQKELGDDWGTRIYQTLIDIINKNIWYGKTKNNKSPEVFYIQTGLAIIKEQFKNALVEADADYGSKTAKVVSSFQTITNISSDGAFGKEAAAAMLITFLNGGNESALNKIDGNRIVNYFKDDKKTNSTRPNASIADITSNDQTSSKTPDNTAFIKYDGPRIDKSDPRYYKNVMAGQDPYATPYVQAVQDFGAELESTGLTTVTSWGRGPVHSMRATFQGPYAIDCILSKYSAETGFKPGDYYFQAGNSIAMNKALSKIGKATQGEGVYGKGGKFEACFKKWEANGAREILKKIGKHDSALAKAKGRDFGKEFWNDLELAKPFFNVKEGDTGHISGYGIDIGNYVDDKTLNNIAKKYGLRASASQEASHYHVNIYRLKNAEIQSENKKLTAALRKILFNSRKY